MDSIIQLVKDPSWWFTAVFVGIFASVIASYFRDGTSLITAHLSRTLRMRRQARLEKEQKRIDFLVLHPDLLIMEMVRVVFQLILFTGNVGLYISLPIFFDVINKTPELAKYNFFSLKAPVEMMLIATSLTGLLAMITGFRISSRLKIPLKARRQYEKEKNRI
jgi:hypothetical protein